MRVADGPRDLLRAGTLDAELAGLLWLLLEARTPLLVAGRDATAARRVAEGLASLLPDDARSIEVAPDDEFAWLPAATELGWREERRAEGADPGRARPASVTASDGVLVAWGLGGTDGVTGARARVVVRALALGYGLIATLAADGLDEVLATLGGPAVGADDDEQSRLGVVLVVADDRGATRVTAAHYVRPVALDTHGHVQRQPPAVLAAWNASAGRWDHFAWGVAPDLAGRLGVRPIDVEREQARRAAKLLEPADGG